MNSTPPSPEAIRQPASAAGLRAAQGSAFRDRLEAMYAAIPWWKKVLTCCVKRKKWNLARAHNKVACSMLLTDNHELGEAVRAAGDKLWAEIYEMPNDGAKARGN